MQKDEKEVRTEWSKAWQTHKSCAKGSPSFPYYTLSAPLFLLGEKPTVQNIERRRGGGGGKGSEKNECLGGFRVPAMDICLRVLLCFLSKEEF